MESFLSIIQTVGFPIACTIALFVILQSEQKDHREETAKLTETITDLKVSFSEAMKEQDNNITAAINNNTLVMQKLLDRIDRE